MKLSKFERVMLMNQYKILAKLETTDEYNTLIHALEVGYDVDNIISYLVEDIISDDIYHYTCDIMAMYEILYQNDKSIVTFNGFDFNCELESDSVSVVNHIVKYENRFSKSLFLSNGYCKNSHHRAGTTYNEQLIRFNEVIEQKKADKLDTSIFTTDEIKAILGDQSVPCKS